MPCITCLSFQIKKYFLVSGCIWVCESRQKSPAMGIMGKWERSVGGRSKPMPRQRTQEAIRRAGDDSEVDKKEKPWEAARKASLIATCLVTLPALVILVVGGEMPSAVTVLVWDMASTTSTSAGQGGGAVRAMAVMEDDECDVSRGRWVRETRGPVYTNLTSSTVADYVNCQKFGKDPGYIHWRWRPDGCDLPRFSPARFLSAVRGKRLAFIGDSLARNHMESLLCLLSQAEMPTDMHAGAFVDAFRRWHFREHDFTLMAVWTEFLVHAVPVVAGRRTGPFDVHLDRVNTNWTRRLPELDYAVISNGNWFFRANYLWEGGRRVGCVDCGEPRLTHFPMAYAVGRVVGAALEAIAGCPDCKSELVTFVRTYTPDHFEHGSWFSGGYCNRTRPLEEAEVSSDAIAWELRAAQIEEVRKVREKTTTMRRRFGVLDVTPSMMMRADGHPGEHHHRWRGRNANDCLHLCLPGPIDMWNDVLLRQFAELSPPSDAR